MIVNKRTKAERSHQPGRAPFWVQAMPQQSPLNEEKAMMIFQPDILIDAQFQSTQRRRFHLDPERVLMLAVLQDAVVCFQEHAAAKCKRKQALHRDAEEWITNTDRSYLFSFENVCETLAFDPDYMREGLQRWKRSLQQDSAEKKHRQMTGRVGT
jgi:predicted phosphoadenosine phosphosulfate sulfurtransferase